MERPLWYRWAKIVVYGAGIVTSGVLLFKYTVPTDEELISRFSPEVRAQYEKNRALRQKEQEELMKIVQKTAASNDPIWKAGPIGSPFEKDTRRTNPNLVDQQKFYAQQGAEFKKEQIEAANKELEELNELVGQKKKHWWSWS